MHRLVPIRENSPRGHLQFEKANKQLCVDFHLECLMDVSAESQKGINALFYVELRAFWLLTVFMIWEEEEP